MLNRWVCVFEGITLEGPNATEVWDPERKNDDADGANQHFGVDQKLIIKMVSHCVFFFFFNLVKQKLHWLLENRFFFFTISTMYKSYPRTRDLVVSFLFPPFTFFSSLVIRVTSFSATCSIGRDFLLANSSSLGCHLDRIWELNSYMFRINLTWI